MIPFKIPLRVPRQELMAFVRQKKSSDRPRYVNGRAYYAQGLWFNKAEEDTIAGMYVPFHQGPSYGKNANASAGIVYQFRGKLIEQHGEWFFRGWIVPDMVPVLGILAFLAFSVSIMNKNLIAAAIVAALGLAVAVLIGRQIYNCRSALVGLASGNRTDPEK